MKAILDSEFIRVFKELNENLLKRGTKLVYCRTLIYLKEHLHISSLLGVFRKKSLSYLLILFQVYEN